MNKNEKMQNSILKNIQELSEFIVSNFDITNYYDLVDYIVDLHNFRAIAHKKNKKLSKEIEKEIESERE